MGVMTYARAGGIIIIIMHGVGCEGVHVKGPLTSFQTSTVFDNNLMSMDITRDAILTMFLIPFHSHDTVHKDSKIVLIISHQ